MKASFARVAAILVALSGLHFVETRVGTVDSYLCLFTVLAFLFMMKFVNSKEKMQYFILSGIFFGCACSVKWSGAFGGIGLALLLFAKLRKNIFKKGNRKWLLRGIFAFILIPLTIYCSSYLLFQNTTRAKNLGDVYNQGYSLFSYHSNETTPHPYSSKWFTWPISLKPMLYVYDSTDNTSIYLMGNYVIALVSVLALILSAYYAFRYKDRRSLIIVVSWLSLFLPYAFIRRTMFLYHYLPASIFAILAVVNLFYLLPGIRKILPAYLLAVLISFIISFPKLAGI
jgi:dolichyl-phosphate-mannose--protein O-mannosyl transferase